MKREGKITSEFNQATSSSNDIISDAKPG